MWICRFRRPCGQHLPGDPRVIPGTAGLGSDDLPDAYRGLPAQGFPQLGIAIARRCTLFCCAANFDDELAVDFVHNSDVSQRGLQLVFQLMGAPPQAAKSFAPGHNRHYLDTSVHVGDFVDSGSIRFQPKFTTQQKVLANCDL